MISNSMIGIESRKTLHVTLFVVTTPQGGMDSPTLLIKELLL